MHTLVLLAPAQRYEAIHRLEVESRALSVWKPPAKRARSALSGVSNTISVAINPRGRKVMPV
jgi:hypothetical protein